MKVPEIKFYLFFCAAVTIGYMNSFNSALLCHAAAKAVVVKNPVTSNAIEWQTSLDKGLEIAKKTKKPIMADFYAEWCGWCKKLDKTSYQDKNVIELSKKFVCVKVNTDLDSASASKYGVQGLPTIIFLSPDGKVTKQIVGYKEGDYFKTVMEELTRK